MQTKRRRVNLKIKANSVLDVLGALSFSADGVLEFALDLPDEKATYRALNHPGVVDWDFEEEIGPMKDEDEEEVANPFTVTSTFPITGPKLSDYLEIEKAEIGLNPGRLDLRKDRGVGNIEELVIFIEGVWTVAKSCPGIRFNTDLFIRSLQVKISEIEKANLTELNISGKTTRAMMQLLIGVYYNNPVSEEDIRTAYLDTIDKIESKFSQVRDADTLNSVMNILYRHEKV